MLDNGEKSQIRWGWGIYEGVGFGMRESKNH